MKQFKSKNTIFLLLLFGLFFSKCQKDTEKIQAEIPSLESSISASIAYYKNEVIPKEEEAFSTRDLRQKNLSRHFLRMGRMEKKRK